MLTDPKEIEIISKARQKNVRDPSRSRKHFEHIFKDFLSSMDLSNQVLMDLGPGQYDFGVIARERGATVFGIDNDPAVLELGKYKNFEMIAGQIQHLDVGQFTHRYDGVFCKFSINAFWFYDHKDKLIRSVQDVCSLLKKDGWAWIAPWNGVPKNAGLSAVEIENILQIQHDEFTKYGFNAFDLSVLLSKRYGVHGATANRALFVRNLTIPRKLKRALW